MPSSYVRIPLSYRYRRLLVSTRTIAATALLVAILNLVVKAYVQPQGVQRLSAKVNSSGLMEPE